MSFLRAAIDRMDALASAGLAKPPTTQPELQRQLTKLDASIGEVEPVIELKPFLRSAAENGAGSLPRFQLNRVLRGAWCDPEFDELGSAALSRAVEEQRRSSDQAVIDGYLTYFPIARPIMEKLADAASCAAQRHEWAWRERGRQWELFAPSQGPARVALDLIQRHDDQIFQLIRETGLGTNLAASGFGQATFALACLATAELPPSKAVSAQRSLLRLFDQEALAGQIELVVRALLEPWINEKPEPEHRKAISDFLVAQIGDPRLQRGRWDSVALSLAEAVGKERSVEIVNVFKRWLTDDTVRKFFRAIALTTDRRDQWEQREKFWLGYLDRALVSDAWPALGRRALYRVGTYIGGKGRSTDYGVVQGGPESSSVLMMRIGDLIIAEWSDNGACRFWNDKDPSAPELYKETYSDSVLRKTAGGSDFEFHPHVPASPGWEAKFADVIYRRTSILHPHFGKGRGPNWSSRW
jgi:hypothetical protein